MDCILFYMTFEGFEMAVADYPNYLNEILDKAIVRLESTLAGQEGNKREDGQQKEKVMETARAKKETIVRKSIAHVQNNGDHPVRRRTHNQPIHDMHVAARFL